MEYQEKIHPTLGILVRSNGEVFVPANGSHKAHWTFGCDNGHGYLRVNINGKLYRVHRLVAEAFTGRPIPEGYEVDHLNRNRKDNALNNIRITTHSQNMRNTRANDRVSARGEKHRYEYADKKQYKKEWAARRNKTHKHVLFSDGKYRYIPNAEALLLLAIPVNLRIFKE